MTFHHPLRILIIAEHASLNFGGEAALPLHYFRILRNRNIETWLIVHERTRAELQSCFAQDIDRIYFIGDTLWHRLLWHLGKLLPQKLSYFTFGFLLRLLTQISQRRIAKQLIQDQQIDLVHQPIPVSPKETSMIYNLEVPVVIGPLNGGMDYPPAFQNRQNHWLSQTLGIGRSLANLMNILIPGKRKATTLLVANPRTRAALPACVKENYIVELVENGVDLSLWQRQNEQFEEVRGAKQITRFVYVGRLVDWKAVDLLLLAFQRIVNQVPVQLDIIGDGSERSNLQQQAKALGLIPTQAVTGATDEAKVRFWGWLPQTKCAQQLQRADALVLPSLYECGGAVVLEAMAMGIPAIATDWGGPKDYLDATCGILVAPDSREAFIENLATAMLKLAKDPALRQAMGKAGRQKVIEQFDWDKKVDAMIEVYKQSIERYAKQASLGSH